MQPLLVYMQPLLVYMQPLLVYMQPLLGYSRMCNTLSAGGAHAYDHVPENRAVRLVSYNPFSRMRVNCRSIICHTIWHGPPAEPVTIFRTWADLERALVV